MYEVTDDELTTLEVGAPSSNQLAVGVSLGTLGLGALATLLLTDVKSDRAYAVVFALASVALIAGSSIAALFYRAARKSKTIIQRIRHRRSGAMVLPRTDDEGQ